MEETARPDEKLNVTFFDVGKGSSVLFEGPEKNVLVDAGSSAGTTQEKYIEQQLKPEIAPNDEGEKVLHHVIASHNDTDHIGYIDDIMDSSIEVKHLYFTGINKGNGAENDIDGKYDSGDTTSTKIENPGAVREILDSELSVTVIRPDTTEISDESTSDINANSLITKVEYDERTFLMPGDVPATVEKWMKTDPVVSLDGIDVLQAQHHATHEEEDGVFSSAFVEGLSSDTTVVIQNRNTDSRPEFHPNCEAVGRMQGEINGIYWTAEHGQIEYVVNPEDDVFKALEQEVELPVTIKEKINNGDGGCE